MIGIGISLLTYVTFTRYVPRSFPLSLFFRKSLQTHLPTSQPLSQILNPHLSSQVPSSNLLRPFHHASTPLENVTRHHHRSRCHRSLPHHSTHPIPRRLRARVLRENHALDHSVCGRSGYFDHGGESGAVYA